jgi:CO/xanthine dehydrogenase FAD-binding subunit
MLPSFEIIQADSIAAAARLLREYGSNAVLLAGGTDTLVSLQEGKSRVGQFINLSGIEELRGIQVREDGGLRIGAMTTFNKIVAHPYVQEHYPYFVKSMSQIGSFQVRNLATIGGNICSAVPSADSAPPLLVSGATVTVSNGATVRVSLYRIFYRPR